MSYSLQFFQYRIDRHAASQQHMNMQIPIRRSTFQVRKIGSIALRYCSYEIE